MSKNISVQRQNLVIMRNISKTELSWKKEKEEETKENSFLSLFFFLVFLSFFLVLLSLQRRLL